VNVLVCIDLTGSIQKSVPISMNTTINTRVIKKGKHILLAKQLSGSQYELCYMEVVNTLKTCNDYMHHLEILKVLHSAHRVRVIRMVLTINSNCFIEQH
jgi:hypothetical protein